MHNLDHIVFGAYTLEEGTDFIEKKLKVSLSDIGYHKEMGTHNRVIRISEEVYLEVIAINPKIKNLKNKVWFNLDNPCLQSKLKKSPQIIGYVIEYNDKKLLKYYDPFFESSRASYKWCFAMPNSKINFLDSNIIESGILPSLISWKSKKPINEMKKNHFELINFNITISKSHQNFVNFFNYFGEVNNISISKTNKDSFSIFKLLLKDNLRDSIISL